MEKKKMKIPRNILCRLCLECCVDGRPLDGFAGYQLHFVLPTIDLGLTSDPHMCRKCCSDIMVHYQFKVKCLDRNEPIYNFMELELLTKNCDNVNNKEKRDKCILCCTKDMNLRQLGGHQEKLLKLMLKLCLPDLDHTLSTICGDCLKCLINVFAFTNACVRTEKKIISYRNRYGVKEPNKVHLRHVVRFTDSGKDGGNIEKETENKKKSFSVASKSDTQLNELNSKARCTDGARCDTNDQNGRSKVNVNDKLQVSLGFKERARRVTDTSTESDNQTPSDGSIKSASCDEIDIDESSEEIEIEMKPEQDIDIKDEPLSFSKDFKNDSNAVDESSPHPEEIIDLCSVPEPKQNNNYNVAVKYYSCDACSYVSKYDSRLVRHKKLYHKKGPTSSGGPSEHGPKRYFIVDEPEEMPKFVCTSCDFTTEYVANIKVHIGSHERKSQKERENCYEIA